MSNLKKEIDIDEHKLSFEDLCSRYNTHIELGLKEDVAHRRLAEHGPNVLTPPKETPLIIKFIKSMISGFSLLLWFAALFCFISYGISTTQDKNAPLDNLWLGSALVIVILLTGTFQFYQESKSDKIMESFKKMIPQEGRI